MENRHDRFLRLATKRTNTILEKIRVLANCSNRSQYSYTEEDVKKIFAAIDNEVREAKAKFSTKRSKKFSL